MKAKRCLLCRNGVAVRILTKERHCPGWSGELWPAKRSSHERGAHGYHYLPLGLPKFSYPFPTLESLGVVHRKEKFVCLLPFALTADHALCFRAHFRAVGISVSAELAA